MNIFILDESPLRSASAHCDKHVIKMILESAQMLSTVLGAGYKPTHKNHPCTLWVAESQDNAEWLYQLAYGLNEEYKKRYRSCVSHKSWDVIRHYHNAQARRVLPNSGLTPFAQAMPEEYKSSDPVRSYRENYRSKPFVAWERGPAPAWW